MQIGHRVEINERENADGLYSDIIIGRITVVPFYINMLAIYLSCKYYTVSFDSRNIACHSILLLFVTAIEVI